jgi:hypothetical protein
MKEFQSRVVATWLVSLPIAFGIVEASRHRVARFTANAQGEIAQELRMAQHASFVGDFVFTFASLVVLMIVVDALATLIRRVMPERDDAASPKPPLF